MRVTSSGARPSMLRELNVRQVVAAVQKHGPLSRADITRLTGISGPTVTRAVMSLLDAGVFEEGALQQAAVGRPGKVVQLASKTVTVLGVVVGARTCEVVASGLDGEMLEGSIVQFATPAKYEQLVSEICRAAQQLVDAGGRTALAVGVSLPGLYDSRTGSTVVSPNVPQTNGRQLGADLAKKLELKTAVLQECDSLCQAEQTFGEARGCSDFAMLDISEGLGLGVMHGGRLLDGHSGLAGELGHVTVNLAGRKCGCGNVGCLETEATDTALATALGERLGRTLSFDEAMQMIQSGELDPEQELTQVLEYLAVGVAAVINIFNPSKLFIYGRVLDVQPTVFERLLALVARRALAPSRADCEIIRARGNKRLGAIAAAIEVATSVTNSDGQDV